MTIRIRLNGGSQDVAIVAAAGLLRELGGTDPEVVVEQDGQLKRLDAGTALGLVSVLLSLPGFVTAGMDIRDRLKRKRLSDHVEELKARLEEFDTEAELTLNRKTSIDLRRASTDRIVDILQKSD